MRRAFVLLPEHLDVSSWRQDWREGRVPDETPYGYHHAETMGVHVSFSQPGVLSGWGNWPFKMVRRLTGLDLRHAWQHRKNLFDPAIDVIWTHTEREFLPAVLLGWLLRRRVRPMIGQIVWLADEWPTLSRWRRWLYRRLLQRVDQCTCLSPDNLAFLQHDARVRRASWVEFGVAPELYRPEVLRCVSNQRPVRVLALGNDRHRDWATLKMAFFNQPNVEVFIASSTCPDEGLGANMRRQACDWPTVQQRYEWADVVVVPLVPNRHASGVTVILEATAYGKPVVATNVGGLAAYLDERAVSYVPAGDALALRQATMALALDGDRSDAFIRNARQQFRDRELDTSGYARRHVQLSEALGA
jgi:glycosyltransferase involved in cell wall biosynthesis